MVPMNIKKIEHSWKIPEEPYKKKLKAQEVFFKKTTRYYN